MNNLTYQRRLSSFNMTPFVKTGVADVNSSCEEIDKKKESSPSPCSKPRKNQNLEWIEVKIKSIEDVLPQFETHLNGLSLIF